MPQEMRIQSIVWHCTALKILEKARPSVTRPLVQPGSPFKEAYGLPRYEQNTCDLEDHFLRPLA